MDQADSKLSLKPHVSNRLDPSLGKLLSGHAKVLEEADARRVASFPPTERSVNRHRGEV
jgi:hypothetical protein